MIMLTTADLFLECLRKSQLVEEADLAAVLEALAADEENPLSPQQLADRLIADGLLTHFQARQLLRSRWQGFLLGGKYRILELLGSGGMGHVFLCQHVRLGIPVAVKVLSPEKMSDDAVRARFDREARAAAALSHPNLVHAFDIDDDGEFSFIVMEYVHGHNLQRLVEERGAFAVARAVSCIRQAARGLQHFFEQGLVHRDIKPGNILLDRQGTIKILDMGLARFCRDTHDQLTQEHMKDSILGTADYLAPEQALDSHRVTIQADIYSLGATFYFLLAGRPPFADGTAAQKMLWHQVRQPPPLRAWRDDVPAELEAVLLRMMAKEPTMRFASPAEVVAALGPWDQPCPPPAEEKLPLLCPAVRRLLHHTSVPMNCPPRLPTFSATGLVPREESLADPDDGDANVLASIPAVPAPFPAPVTMLSLPARGLRPQHLAWTAGTVLLVCALVGGAYWGYLHLFPPPLRPARPPQLDEFDPLAGIKPGSVIPDYLAIGQVGQTRTVRLTVRARERDRAGTIFLYSSLPRHPHMPQANMFTVAIPASSVAVFKRAGDGDPYVFFMGQTIDVKGPIKYLTEGFRCPGIEAREPSQIQLVNAD